MDKKTFQELLQTNKSLKSQLEFVPSETQESIFALIKKGAKEVTNVLPCVKEYEDGTISQYLYRAHELNELAEKAFNEGRDHFAYKKNPETNEYEFSDPIYRYHLNLSEEEYDLLCELVRIFATSEEMSKVNVVE